MRERVRILLVDDHTLVRQGVKRIIEEDKRFTVAGEAVNGDKAVALTDRLNPDVVIMDLSMPGTNGLEALEMIKEKHPGIKVIILTMHSHEAYIQRSFALGANGFLLKDNADVDLLTALRSVCKDDIYLSPDVSHLVDENYVKRISSDAKDLFSLSKREVEILKHIVNGKTNREIAGELFISVRTVEHHRANLMEKTGSRNLADLFKFAIEQGFTGLKESN